MNENQPEYLPRLTPTFVVIFPGMTARLFRGIPSIQEVECWGGKLDSDAKLLSLQIYRNFESSVLASLNLYTNNCMTYGDLSSCSIDKTDPHRSKLMVLVHDLAEGEETRFGCKAISMKPSGNTKTSTWTILVKRNSK